MGPLPQSERQGPSWTAMWGGAKACKACKVARAPSARHPGEVQTYRVVVGGGGGRMAEEDSSVSVRMVDWVGFVCDGCGGLPFGFCAWEDRDGDVLVLVLVLLLDGGPRRAMAAILDSGGRSRRLGRCDGNPKKVLSSVPAPCRGDRRLPVVQDDQRERAVFFCLVWGGAGSSKSSSSSLSLVGSDDAAAHRVVVVVVVVPGEEWTNLW